MKKIILSFFLSFFLFLSLGFGQSSTQTQFRGVFQWRNVTAWPDTAEAHYHVEFGNFNDQGGEYLAAGVDSTCVAWDNLGGRWRVVRVDSATVASAWVLVKSLNASWGVPFGVGFVSKETEGGAGLSLTAPDNSTGISPQLQARIEGHNMILIDNLFEDVVLNMVDTFYMAADTGGVQQLLATDTIKINGGYGVVTGLNGENRTVIWADTLELSTVYHSEHYADSLFLLDLDQDPTNEIQYVDSLTLSGTTLGVSLSSDEIPAVTVNLAPILSGYPTGSGAAGQVTYWNSATSITGENNLFWDAANDRLGVGTATPLNAIHVNGSVSSGMGLYIRNQSAGAAFNGGAAIVLENDNSSGSGQLLKLNSSWGTYRNLQGNDLGIYNSGVGNISIYNNVASADIDFLTGTSWVVPQMTLDDTGYLGLNNTAPSYPLDINYVSGIRIPVGTTAQRPTNAAGVKRYNSSLGYSETGNGSSWLQSDFPVGSGGSKLFHNGTSWVVASNVYGGNDYLSIGGNSNTSPLTFVRTGLATNNLIRFSLTGIDQSYIDWSGGSTSSYLVGKNGSGYFVILEDSNNGLGIAYNREQNSVNINDVFDANGTLSVTYRAPGTGTQNNVLYLEGSSTSQYFIFQNNGVLRANTTNNARTYNFAGTMFLADGSSNIFLNSSTSLNPTNGNHNIVVGFQCGGSLASGGEQNIIMGRGAAQSLTTGDNNVIMGWQAGNKVTGLANIFIGQESGIGGATNTANYNIGLGYRAGYAVTSGGDNIFMGSFAGANLSSGVYNVIMGYTAGSAVSTGGRNTFIGHEAGGLGTGAGSYNIGIGARGLYDENDTNPSYAIGIGYETGYLATEVDNCVFLGRSAGAGNTYSNVVVIGYGSTASQNAQIAIGTGTNYTQLKSRNYAFNIDQTVGAGQDNYVLKYNHSSGEIELDVDEGTGAMMDNIYTVNDTFEESRTVTIKTDSMLTIQMSGGLSNLTMTKRFGYIPDWGAYGWIDEASWDDYSFYNYMFDDGTGPYAGWGVSDNNDFSNAFFQINENGNITALGSNGTDNGSFNVQGGTAAGYAPYVHGDNGIEFDTGGGGKIYFQINNTTEAVVDATGVGVGDTSPESSLDVAGMTKTRQLVGQDGEPTTGTNANMGTGRSVSVTASHSSGLAGRFSFTSGTGLTAGEWFTFTFPYSFSEPPAVQIFPEDADGASLMPYIYVQPTTTGCSFGVNVTGGAWESKTFEFNYIIIGGN